MLANCSQCSLRVSIPDELWVGGVNCPDCREPLAALARASVHALMPHGDDETADPSVDQISGMGFVLLLACGVLAIAAGYTAAGLCAGLALGINIIHNLLPNFYFVMPLIIVLFMAMAPMVYGATIGSVMYYGAQLVNFRNNGVTSFIAFFWAIVGVVVFPYVCSYALPPRQEFFDDILMPYVCKMIGGCINFEWLAEPKPVPVPPWIVYAVLVATTALGLIVAAGRVISLEEDDP